MNDRRRFLAVASGGTAGKSWLLSIEVSKLNVLPKCEGGGGGGGGGGGIVPISETQVALS